jgi:dihydroxyacid dehydratase/phosphogluconate dehydratase
MATETPVTKVQPQRRFRSRDWFDDPKHIDMVALYLERFMNYGLTADELLSGKPIVGIVQSGSDINPCNRIHLETVKRVREGVREAGGIAMEFPLHPIFENCRRPTAALDRNLAYLGLVEILHGYPIDAVVLTTGCDKTTPAQVMAASTVDIPAIVLSGGPMLDGWHDGELVGSGTVIWRSRRKLAAGKMSERQFLDAAIAAIAAIGGSTNAQPHLVAMARHAGIELTPDDWMTYGRDVPLLVNVQPAGKYLGEGFHRAGGVPAVLCELLRVRRIDGSALTVTGRSIADNIAGREAVDRDVIKTYEEPLQKSAGFLVLKGNLFDFAIMKTSVISEDFRRRYLAKGNAFEGRAVVFDGSTDYHERIDDPKLGIDEQSILVIRGSGPIGWPGSAEVVNMQPPAALLQRGIMSLPTLGDGRQSGTSDSPSILNCSPESAAGGGLAWLRTGDKIRIDLDAGRCDALVSEEEIARRKREPSPPIPENATPWQEIYRSTVGQLDTGAVMELAVKYRGVARKTPRHNH